MDPAKRLSDTLARLVPLLSQVGIRYHCTGGVVSFLYGEPRFTQDIDIVLAIPDSEQLSALVNAVQPDFFVDEVAVREAIRQRRMFQLLDRITFFKVDLHVGEDVPGELERTVAAELLPGLTVPVVSKEDAILSKLLWATRGSDKSRRDIVSMLRRPGPLQVARLDQFAVSLGVAGLLDELRREASQG